MVSFDAIIREIHHKYRMHYNMTALYDAKNFAVCRIVGMHKLSQRRKYAQYTHKKRLEASDVKYMYHNRILMEERATRHIHR